MLLNNAINRLSRFVENAVGALLRSSLPDQCSHTPDPGTTEGGWLTATSSLENGSWTLSEQPVVSDD